MLDHGSLYFKFEGNILFVDGQGPWNKEAILLSADTANAEKRKRIVPKWGVLITIIGDPIHTPDAAELLTDYVKADKKNGRVATALILTESTFPELGRRHISELYDQAGEHYQFFNNREEAQVWLNALLAD